MPSSLHEGPILLFRERPELLSPLLVAASGFEPLDRRLCIENADFSIAVPIERRADLALSHGEEAEPVNAFVVEVQLEIDEEKWFTWPFYLASLHTQRRCPTYLIVVTPFESVAEWARRPILTMQPSSPISPIVLGPKEIPGPLSDEDAMALPELAVLAAIVHGRGEGGDEILRRAIRVIARLDERRREKTYFDLLYTIVGERAKIALEALMSQHQEEESAYVRICREFGHRMGLAEGREEGREEGLAEGREEEARRAILVVLEARGIAPTPALRERVEGCSELALLEQWLRRAVVTASADEVFDV